MYPNKYYGIIENPLLYSVFCTNNSGGAIVYRDAFRFLSNELWKFLDHQQFLLLGH